MTLSGPTAPRARRRLAGGIAGAALLIAVVTILSRMVGFGRWLVFSHTVAASCLGDAYNTANQMPNIIFEVVAGGALASVAVPVLASPLARGDRAQAARTASALLTWTLMVLTPVAVVGILLARPLTEALLDAPQGCQRREFLAVVFRMLLVFLPQIPLYGVAVVVSGVLQADRRFLAPVLAPLLSNPVVIAAYLTFSAISPAGNVELAQLSRMKELALSVGTTLGVVTLAVSQIVALRRSGLRLRPTFVFPPGIAPRARGLAMAGIVTLAAQQAAALAILGLTNHRGNAGALTVYTLTWAVYLLPYAVLVFPIATSAFPRLVTRFEAGDRAGYATDVATTSRAVLLVAAVGTGVMIATAYPVARVFLQVAGAAPDPEVMAHALVAFAPGLLGYAVVNHMGRVLYAAGRGKFSAAATALGWLVVVLADVVCVIVFPRQETVTALGIGNAIGMTVAGVLLVAATCRGVGVATLAGVGRAVVVAILGALVAAAVGTGIATRLTMVAGHGGMIANASIALVTGLVAVFVFTVVAFVGDSAGVRALIARRWRQA